MRARHVSLAVGVVLALGVAASPRPAVPAPAAAPSLALSARTAVPAPVMATLRRACFDCHSSETRWPWYARVPPASYLLARDVREGRAQLDWSHWEEYNRFDRAELLDKVCERASSGVMPPWPYRLAHRNASLQERDLRELCAWTDAMNRKAGDGRELLLGIARSLS